MTFRPLFALTAAILVSAAPAAAWQPEVVGLDDARPGDRVAVAGTAFSMQPQVVGHDDTIDVARAMDAGEKSYVTRDDLIELQEKLLERIDRNRGAELASAEFTDRG